jgi:hypothetical protein
MTAGLTIRPLREDDLATADRIFRLAFGTFLRLPDPLQFAGDSDWVRSRWRTDPSTALAAELDGAVVGSNFATCWGSVGLSSDRSPCGRTSGTGASRTVCSTPPCHCSIARAWHARASSPRAAPSTARCSQAAGGPS